MSETTPQKQLIGGYVNSTMYLEMRLRMLLTGTNAPSKDEWADALKRLLTHLQTNPVPEGPTCGLDGCP